MPVAFGSVGDIIAVALLVKDLANTLSESRGASAEYQTTTRELRNLENVLRELQSLADLCDKAPGIYNALAETAKLEVQKCKALILPFSTETEKYGQSLRVGGSGNSAQDAYRKIHWKLSHKGRLEEFRRAIRVQNECMTALLVNSKR
jgi:hypothetical protein